MEVRNTEQAVMIKTIPQKKKFKKAKWLSEEASQIAERREAILLRARRKEKIYTTDCRVPEHSKGLQSSREQQGKIRKPS